MGCASSTASEHVTAAQQLRPQPLPTRFPVAPTTVVNPPAAAHNQNTGASKSRINAIPVVRNLVSFTMDEFPVEGDSLRLHLSARCAGTITTYFLVKPCDEGVGSKHLPPLSASKTHEVSFSDGLQQSIPVFLCTNIAEAVEADSTAHHLVIDIQAESQDAGVIRLQRFYFNFNPERRAARVTRQLVQFNNVVRKIDSLFGTLQRESNRHVESEGGDCVVCLSRPRTVAILHCRHVCLCETCAKIPSSTWSHHCPICRGKVATMVSCAECP